METDGLYGVLGLLPRLRLPHPTWTWAHNVLADATVTRELARILGVVSVDKWTAESPLLFPGIAPETPLAFVWSDADGGSDPVGACVAAAEACAQRWPANKFAYALLNVENPANWMPKITAAIRSQLVVDVLPVAKQLWYNNGSVRLTSAGLRAYPMPLQPGPRACSLYLGNDLAQEVQRFSATLGPWPEQQNPPSVTPWIALACRYALETTGRYSHRWSWPSALSPPRDPWQADYSIERDWLWGAMLNSTALWRAARSGDARFVNASETREVVLYPRPFDLRLVPGAWLHHFTAYLRGSAGLPLEVGQ